MRHVACDFRLAATRLARAGSLAVLMAVAVLAAAPVPCALAQNADPAVGAEVTGMRLGRHADFLRLVFDLTARPGYDAHATGPRAFVVSLPGVALPPEGHAALAGDPLAPDLIVRPTGDAGSLRFHVTSRDDAFIRRAFVIAPPAGGVAPGASPWRLVFDIVPRPGHHTAAVPSPVVVGLPAPHGIDLPEADDGHPTDVGLAASEPSDRAIRKTVVAGPGPQTPPPVVEVSWAKASRILRELQARRAPEADTPPPPQLILPPKYRRDPVPLR